MLSQGVWGSTQLSPTPWTQRAAGSLDASVLLCRASGLHRSQFHQQFQPLFQSRRQSRPRPQRLPWQPGCCVSRAKAAGSRSFICAAQHGAAGSICPSVAPKAFTLVPADRTRPSRCSGSLRQEGLPFPHFIARAGAVSVLVRVGVRQRHLPVPECSRGVGGACRLVGHAPMRGRCRPRPLVAMAVKRRCPVPPKLRTGFISVGVTRCMGVALGVVITMGVVTKRGGATIQAGLAHHAARAGRGS